MSDCEASPYRALSTLVSPVDVKITVRKDPTRPYVGLENIPSRGAHLVGWSLASSSISANSIFQAGDVLFGKLRPNLRKCVIAPFDGYCSTDILVLRPNIGVDPSFAGKVLRTERVGAAAEMTAVGTKMPRTSWKYLSELKVFCPGFPEQSKIADVLDTLDTAIHEIESIIAKLEAVKQGLLHDLLTRGIDAKGELRPPQAEAPHLYKESPLGWIPKEWRPVSVKDAGHVKLGRQRSPAHERGRHMRPYLRVANVFDGYIDYSDILEMNFSPVEQDTFSLVPGDILLNEGQSLELVGRCAIYEGSPRAFFFQNTLIRFRASEETVPAFARHVFKYWLDTGRFTQVAKQTTSVAHLGADRFAAMDFPAPMRGEQAQIAEHMRVVLCASELEAAQLAKLKQQKSGLMDDLLTGRVRVTPLLADTEPQRVCA